MELTLNKLSKKYGNKTAVDEISITLHPGLNALLGANGSGKTTMLRMITDIINPTSGEVLYNHKPIQTLQENYLCDIGYMPQHLGMYPNFKVIEFLNYMAVLKGLDKTYTKARIETLLKLVHLEERAHFKNIISSICQDKIVILSTHIVSDISNIADKIIIMKEGKIISYDTEEHLLEEMKGKVYSLTIPNQEVVIHPDDIVVSKKVGKENTTLRMICDTNIEGATVVEPDLNDLYLYYFKDGDIL